MRLLTLLASTAVFLGLQMGTATADECDNANDQATMNVCAQQSLKASDVELNRLYKQIQIRLAGQPETGNLLVAAQRAWIAFRDAECAFTSSGVAGGSVHPMMVMMCRDGLTRDRIKDLKSYLSCEEGDLSCPVPVGE